MIDIKKLIAHKEEYLKGFKNKNYSLEHDVNEVIKKYEAYLDVLSFVEFLSSKINKTIELETMKRLNKISEDDFNKKIEELNLDFQKFGHRIPKNVNRAELEEMKAHYNEQLNKFESEYKNILAYFPNIPEQQVHVGKDENDNKVVLVKDHAHKKHKGVNHYDVIDKLDLLYKDEAVAIAGPRQLVYKTQLAQLVYAVEQLMLDTHISAGIEQIEPPVIVNAQALFNTGQLPKFEEDLFKLTNGQYLIPTAEVPVTNLAAGKLYKEDQLPIRWCALTSCFRSEAGAAGRDTRGMIRVHQFRKTELVTIGKPADSKKDFDEMLHQATKILDLLEISYRVIELCTGDMGFASQRTYDIEVWLPGAEKYREISSVSCCGDFQARRMNAKYQTADKKKELVFTYNGSALAVERTIAAIIENYYDEKQNAIIVPQVLRKYLKFDKITK